MAELQVLAAFLGGLASFFSPCVYPLIPVVISYSCGAGSSLRTAFYSSFLYVLGLAVTMVMAGVVVTFLAGTFLSAAYVSIISSIGAFAIGLTFGFSWIPCVTPIYLSILSLAAVEGSVLHAAILMLFYAFGVGLPLVALGVVAVYAKVSLGKRSRRAMLYIEKIAGGVLVLLGVNNILPFFALPKFIPL